MKFLASLFLPLHSTVWCMTCKQRSEKDFELLNRKIMFLNSSGVWHRITFTHTDLSPAIFSLCHKPGGCRERESLSATAWVVSVWSLQLSFVFSISGLWLGHVKGMSNIFRMRLPDSSTSKELTKISACIYTLWKKHLKDLKIFLECEL